MGLFNRVLDAVKDAVMGKTGGRSFRGHDVKPASEDPYGDPADQMRSSGQRAQGSAPGRFGNVKPASEDPYGDPADQKR